MAKRRTQSGLKVLDFEVIRREFEQTLEFVLNRVERALPESPDVARARKLHARGTLHLAKSYYRAIRRLSVQKPSADVVPPELSVAIAPINRALCELFASSVFMLADFENRWPVFERSGWWENQREYHRLSKYFKDDPEWKSWLRDFWQKLIVEGGRRLGIGKAERRQQKPVQPWPNPSRMFDLACPVKADTFKVRLGLLAVRDLIYSDLSQKAHLSFLGFVKQSQPALIGAADNLSPSISERHQSGEVFVTLVLVSVLLSWIDRVFQLGATERIRNTWRIVGEYDPVAREIYRAWYHEADGGGMSLNSGPLLKPVRTSGRSTGQGDS
jgi:hypothetical protein